jgi:flagella basal body P-ring formation protein FlgA
LAQDRPTLRGDVVAHHDALTLGDLVLHAPAALAATPLFRAPPLGQAGTVQSARIVSAAAALGIDIETGGRPQIAISRAAREIGSLEIEAALRTALARDLPGDPLLTGFAFDGTAPKLLLPAGTPGAVVASELNFDRRSRRVSATVSVEAAPGDRRGQIRVTGALVDLVEVATPTRALERGESLKPTDITVERRPRDSVTADAVYDGAPLKGRVARRALAPGAPVRSADLIRPEIVGRGDTVTVVYEMPGVSLSLRAKALAAGSLGDTVGILNPISKKTLQGVIVGPGRVSVSAAPPSRLAAAAPTP